MNLVLLLLLTGSWAAARSGRPRLAGVLLGIATAIKLFPGFLLAYYAPRRRWSLVAAGLITLIALTGLTLAVLGLETYRTYIQVVPPEIQWFRVGWNNNSIAGSWYRLFDTAPEKERAFSRSEPLWYSPSVARAATWIGSAAVIGALAWAVRRVRPEGEAKAYGLAVTTMLLISPIAREHYFLLLLVPLAVFWLGLPPSRWLRALFVVILVAFWTSPVIVWTFSGIGGMWPRRSKM